MDNSESTTNCHPGSTAASSTNKSVASSSSKGDASAHPAVEATAPQPASEIISPSKTEPASSENEVSKTPAEEQEEIVILLSDDDDEEAEKTSQPPKEPTPPPPQQPPVKEPTPPPRKEVTPPPQPAQPTAQVGHHQPAMEDYPMQPGKDLKVPVTAVTAAEQTTGNTP